MAVCWAVADGAKVISRIPAAILSRSIGVYPSLSGI
jgi:hypothetical protein